MAFPCEICSKSFSVKRSLIRHVDSRHKKIKVFCSLCHKPFSRSDSLAHHINTMHPVKQGKRSAEPRKRRGRGQAVKVMREQVRVKRERKRLPPFHIPAPPIAEESCPPLPAEPEQTTKVQQEPPIQPKVFPVPFVDFLPKEPPAPTLMEIKPELHLEVEPCIELVAGCGDDYPAHMAEKPKRFTAVDELDFTVLDLMQQSAIDAKDEDRMFLLSILSDFKRVPMEKKLKVKARIVGAIVDALD